MRKAKVSKSRIALKKNNKKKTLSTSRRSYTEKADWDEAISMEQNFQKVTSLARNIINRGLV